MIKKIGIIGLGTVGEATVKSLIKYDSLIERRTGLKIQIEKICDLREEKKNIAIKEKLAFTTDPKQLIEDPEIDIIVELIGGKDPAYHYIMESLKRGKSVVTANKALLAQCGRDLFSLARVQGRSIGFEASVCGAIPLIKSIAEGLVSCEIRSLYGILNGTTNYILYQMAKEKIDFKTALHQAQDKGFAEKNPYLDVEGFDAAHKLSILSYLCFGVLPPFEKIYREGITKISLLDICYAQELNYTIKLLAIAKRDNNILDLRVHPTLISKDHPLAQTALAFNAVHLDTKPAGSLLFHGEGAGGVPTSSAVIADIVNISLYEQKVVQKEDRFIFKSINQLESRYYIRFMAHNEPGVLARVSKILASFNISMASVTQKESKQGGKFVPVVMITYKAKEENINKAINKIDQLPCIKSPTQVIRIEDL